VADVKTNGNGVKSMIATLIEMAKQWGIFAALVIVFVLAQATT